MGETIMQRQRFLFVALGLLTLWRWALLPTLELAPEEALAAVGVKHGPWSGLHGMGPVMPLLAWLGMMIGGAGEFGVRFSAPLLALVSSLAVWRLMRGMFDAQIAGWAVVIVNVLPAFNLAAITLTPATVTFALVPLLALCLRVALLHANPLHWGWWAAGVCVFGAAMVQPPALGVMAAVVLAFALPERLRHHLHGSGFIVIATSWLLALFFGPGWWGGLVWPEWRLIPNVFRWVVLASPVLLALFAVAVRMALGRATRMSLRSLPLAMLLPLAGADFFYGPGSCWPDMGGAVWMVFAAMVLAHRGTVLGGITSEEKISLRTIAIVLAALQSAFLLQTDLPRMLGLVWRFSRQAETSASGLHFFTSDPSRAMRGWRESAKVVSASLDEAARDGTWFVAADDWRLAAALNFYMHNDVPVRPVSDGMAGLGGRGVLYVTEDPAAFEPPEALRRQFGRSEMLSVARVMHAGNEVRWLKIFACHADRTPDS